MSPSDAPAGTGFIGSPELPGNQPKRPAPVEVTPVSLADYKVPSSGKGKKPRKDDYQREIQQIKERTAELQAETTAQAGLNPLIDDYGYAVTKAKASAELLNAAQKAGLKITPEVKAQIDTLAEGYANATAEANRLAESQQRTIQIAEDMKTLGKDVLGGFISDLAAGKSASEALASALGKVADKLLDMALDNLFGLGAFKGAGLFGRGGLFGGTILPGILHSGGVAGRDGYGHGRAVSPSVFAGAPRYHSGGIAGLRPGEVPAILQQGEVILPRGSRSSATAGPQITINAPINAPGADAAQLRRVEQSVRDLGRNIPKMVDGRLHVSSTRKVRA